MPGADLPSSLSRTSTFHFCYCTVRLLSLCGLLLLGTIFFALFYSYSILLFNGVIFESLTVLPLFYCRDTTSIVQNILYCSTGTLRLQILFRSLSFPLLISDHTQQLTHNSSHTTAHTNNSLNHNKLNPINSNFQKEHAVQDQHVFHQKHPRRFGYRCSCQHSSWTYGHGHASPIRQSQ